MSVSARSEKSVTILDVAKAAGVSAMTVSNVLNGRGRVSSATADHIREVVDRLGYRPSVAARRLRLSQQWAIGMLIVVEDPDFLSDPFITAEVTGLTNYLTKHSYSLIIRGVRPSDFRTHGLFQGVEADGIVAVLSGTEEQRDWFLGEIATLRVPIVALHEEALSSRPDCLSLRQDDYDGGLQIGRHLLATGARTLWMLIPEAEWPAMQARRAGVEAALREVGGPALRRINCGTENFDDTYAATAAALGEHGTPDAIVGGNDQLAIAAMMTCAERGLVVPRDVQITGFNGFDYWRYVQPALTTVKSSAHLLGERAAQELLARLQTGSFPEQDIVLPVQLRAGKSTRG